MSNAEKWESLVREITCAALSMSQLADSNERGQVATKRCTAKHRRYQATVCYCMIFREDCEL